MGDLKSLQLADSESVLVSFKISYLQGFIVALPESPLQLLFSEVPAHTIFSVNLSWGDQNSLHFSFVIKGTDTYCSLNGVTKIKCNINRNQNVCVLLTYPPPFSYSSTALRGIMLDQSKFLNIIFENLPLNP